MAAFHGDGTTYSLGGQVSAGNCNFMSHPPAAVTKYAALNGPQWASTMNCGRCAQVTCVDDLCANAPVKSEVVYIVDQCPGCVDGDLDLSPEVFKSLTGMEPARVKIEWSFVNCPVQGNVEYCLKSGSSPFWLAVQPTNMVSGVKSLTINGMATTMVDSAFYFLLDGKSTATAVLSQLTISMTSMSGETITDTVALKANACTKGDSQFGSAYPVAHASAAAASTPTTSARETPTPTTPPPVQTSAPTPTSSEPLAASPKETPAPAPSTDAPAPTTTAPAPTTVAPAPSTDAPAPTSSALARTAPAPAPSTAPPAPTTSALARTAAPPAPSTEPPAAVPAPTTASPTNVPATSEPLAVTNAVTKGPTEGSTSSSSDDDDKSEPTSSPSVSPVSRSEDSDDGNTNATEPTPSPSAEAAVDPSASQSPSPEDSASINTKTGDADVNATALVASLAVLVVVSLGIVTLLIASARKKKTSTEKTDDYIPEEHSDLEHGGALDASGMFSFASTPSHSHRLE